MLTSALRGRLPGSCSHEEAGWHLPVSPLWVSQGADGALAASGALCTFASESALASEAAGT